MTSSLISPSFQGGPTILINVLWGNIDLPHHPFCCLNERAQTFKISLEGIVIYNSLHYWICPCLTSFCFSKLPLVLQSFFLFLSWVHALIASPRVFKPACTQIWDKKKESNVKKRVGSTHGKEGLYKKLQIPTLPPKSPRSGVTFQ